MADKKGGETFREKMKGYAKVGKDAVREALDPKTIMVRLILVLVPAVLMCLFRVFCMMLSPPNLTEVLKGGGTVSVGCMSIGIFPRTLKGLLVGVPLAPFVNLSNAQLFANLAGWLSLAFGLTAYGPRLFFLAFTFLSGFSGLATWLLGRGAVPHAGASGVLFGIFGFHLSILPFRRPFHWTDLASFCVFDVLYGGIWWGLCFQSPGATWELSVFGLVGGVIFAWVYFHVFHESVEDEEAALRERLPLMGSGFLQAERKIEGAIGYVADEGVAELGRANSAISGRVRAASGAGAR